MADPITLAMGAVTLGSAAAGGAGALAGIAGAKSGGAWERLGIQRSAAAQANQFLFKAGISKINQEIAKQNRDYALSVGEAEALRYGMKARQERGAIRASQGASGIDIGSASSRDVREGQDKIAKMDLETIRKNAARVAYGHTIEGIKEEVQEGLYSAAAKDARAGAEFKVMGSMISEATSVADKWLQLGQKGFGVSGFKTGINEVSTGLGFGTVIG